MSAFLPGMGIKTTHYSRLKQTVSHSGEAPPNLNLTSDLETRGIVAAWRRCVYFLLCGMAVYMLSWFPVLYRVVRGIIDYPDKMPTAVWVSTLGILVFYDTFVIAQCTTLMVRINGVLSAQDNLLAPNVKGKYSVLYLFAEQNRVCKCYRNYAYTLFVHICSMPGWKAIAFLAGGITIDLVSAVLFGIPSIRDFFGVHEVSKCSRCTHP